MEPIRDIDKHVICKADPYRGIIERATKKGTIRILLPLGGEVEFISDCTYTVIRRERMELFYVNSIHMMTG